MHFRSKNILSSDHWPKRVSNECVGYGRDIPKFIPSKLTPETGKRSRSWANLLGMWLWQPSSCIQPAFSALPCSAQRYQLYQLAQREPQIPSSCSITQLERCLPSLPCDNKKLYCATGFVRSWEESQPLQPRREPQNAANQTTGSLNNLGSLWVSMD